MKGGSVLGPPRQGREQLAVWSSAAVWALRIHQLCILAMLVGAGTAAGRAYPMRSTRNVTHDGNAPNAPSSSYAGTAGPAGRP